ncbi:protein LKAAEAR1 [Oncorhynchus mykiss]|uniref:protein LKAAEAR1 n=2 Tax=Oncorhynchus TaxID=8016 RepID=UPI000B4FBE93|nr:protein LKAAEAR1 [Oncorhynchus mykiss]
MSSKSDNKLSTCGNRRRSSATKEDVKRMCPQQRARYLAYEEPPKEAKTWMAMSRQRVSAWESSGAGGKRHTTVGHHHCDERDEEEKKRQDLIIGQLKAAEARNRVRQMRLQYRSMRTQEINLMISCQSSAQTAVRLELLLPTEESKINTIDCLDKLQRKRVEEILDDEKGLTITRR